MLLKNSRLPCWFFALALCVLGMANTSKAAVFTLQPADKFGPVSVLIKGRIDLGDFDKFKSFLVQPGHLKAYANYVWLDSIDRKSVV